MALNFNAALDGHPRALLLREKRSEVLAANIANADTPGYKARDLDFREVLKGTLKPDLVLEKTHPAHIAPTPSLFESSLRYRFPNQASLDGNTVEAHVEQSKYAENMVQYQASLKFVSGDFKDLNMALKGQA